MTSAPIDELMRKAADAPFSREDIDTACLDLNLAVGELFDAISRRIVEGYTSGELSFSFCDTVMNHVYSFQRLVHDMVSDYSYSVFQAFDEGEYQHPDDPADSSPEDLYTKPMIAEIAANHAKVI
jgi:tRNA A37 threonylcarbamoyltransferase TsaD